MNLHQIENIITISEEKSITRAAEKLFVTQSTLTQQLQQLEAELGTPLFVRDSSDWQLTPAGVVYIQAAKNMLSIKEDAYSKIHDMAEHARKQITVGLVPERGMDMFITIYPQFHSAFPEIILEPVECSVSMMQQQIAKGEMNLGLAALTEQQKDENVYLHMTYEEIFLAVPREHPLAGKGTRIAENAQEISLESFSKDPFVLTSQSSTMYQIVKGLFDVAGFEPKVLFSTSSNVGKYRMVNAGVGCALLPAVFAAPADHIVYFRLPQRPHWEITMCYGKNTYLSRAEKEFLNLCSGYWNRK